MSLKKIKIILFIPIAIFFIANLFYFPMSAKAKDNGMLELTMPELQVEIPGLSLSSIKCGLGKDCGIPWIGEYIAGIYKYAIGIVGILAAVILMVAGVIWLIAGGNASQITEAKAWITASLTGLIIALCSYTILYQVNPDLLKFKPIIIPGVANIPMTTNVSARGSGLEICSIGEQSGIKLFLPKQGVKTQNSWWPWMDNLIDEAFNKAFADPTMLTNGCKSYCASTFYSKIITVGRFKNDNNTACCVCDKMSYTRNTIETNIKLKYNIPNDIEAQFKDASNELLNFLNCMANESKRISSGQIKKNTISSIGDSNYTGRLKECDIPSCIIGRNFCQHSCQSCHYGGGSKSGKSYAVDIGNGGADAPDSVNQNIKTAARKCNAKYIRKENNHIHISVNPCAKDGDGSNY